MNHRTPEHGDLSPLFRFDLWPGVRFDAGMRLLDSLTLLFLAAIWGASFLFMRVASPEFGPIPLVLVRVGVAMLCLLPFVLSKSNRGYLRSHARPLFLVGMLNSALPFCLFNFASLSLEAGFTSLLNATTPLFTALIGWFWWKQPLRVAQRCGLLLGVVGVAILAGDKLSFKAGGTGWAVLAGLAGATCYGIILHITRRDLADVPAPVSAGGGLIWATMVIAPFAIPMWPDVPLSITAWGCALGLALLSSALAYVLLFWLIARVGATSTATVTFIIPVFAIFWGWLFLGEQLTVRVLLGMVLTFMGTGFVTRVFSRDT